MKVYSSELAKENAQKDLTKFEFKMLDAIGRCRAYGRGSVSGSEFFDVCMYLDAQLKLGLCSKWSARGIVRDHLDIAKISAAFSKDTAIEVNCLPIFYNGVNQHYMWISKNIPARLPSIDEREIFLKTVEKRIELQRRQKEIFFTESTEDFLNAKKHGLQLVCNDPFGEWGENQIKSSEFHDLIGGFFYVNEEVSSQMVSGRGYSSYHHYLFGIRSSSGELLGVFVLAKWPWGFEGTYTMVKPDRYIAKLGVAKIMMLASNALILSRYGDRHLIYGEANTANCRPCIQAGYDIVPPRVDGIAPNAHENVVWADNPIGEYQSNMAAKTPHPPSYAEQPYANYVLMKLDSARVMPFIHNAFKLLAV